VGGVVVVFVNGAAWMSYDCDDLAAKRVAIVNLAERRIGTHAEISLAFGVEPYTVGRYVKDYREGGVACLMPKRKGPKSVRVTGGQVDKVILAAKRIGRSNREIAASLGIAPQSVCNALQRLGWRAEDKQESLTPDEKVEQTALTAGMPVETSETTEASETTEQPRVLNRQQECPQSRAVEAQELLNELSKRVVKDPTELPVQTTADSDPSKRSIDRFLAVQGLLDDAAPLFEDAQNVREVGALLGIAVAAEQGFFYEAMRVLHAIGPAFYGLRTSLVCLSLLMILNLCRTQDVMRRQPSEMGRLLGLDRSPERKTLGRKLKNLVGQGRSLALMDALASRRLRSEDGQIWAYIDGHVTVYTGKHQLREHHVASLRAARPSMIDYWVNQPDGDPLMVVTGTENEGLVKQIPEVIAKLKSMAKERNLTIVFDREGWSPKLFAEIQKASGVHFLTYRKALPKKKLPRLALSQFQTYDFDNGGRRLCYQLADTQVRISYRDGNEKHSLQLRQITRRKDNGKQVHVLTDDLTTAVEQLALRMFGRWSQENFFKYGKQHQGLDALVSHKTEPVDTSRLVPNPKRKRVQQKIDELESKLRESCLQCGQQVAQGCKPDNKAFRKEINALEADLERLRARRSTLPSKVPLRETEKGKDAVQPNIECRRLLHQFRISANHTELALLELLRPHFKDWRHEGRALVRDILHSSGNLRVTKTHLHVEVKSQASPYKTRALAVLCQEITRLDVTFPGSSLKMAFTIAPGRSSPSSPT